MVEQIKKKFNQKNLDTSLLLFMLGLLISHSETLASRGEWMKNMESHKAEVVFFMRETNKKLAYLIKLEKES